MRRGCGGVIGMIVFMGIFFVAGIGITYWGSQILGNANKSVEWPTAMGRVIFSDVREDSDEDGASYHADVSYEYVVNDREYLSDQVSFGQYGSSNYSHAAEIVRRYPVGERVTVYYNPEQPETAVLEPGVTWSSYMVLVMGLCFMGVPLLIAVGGLFNRLRGV